VVQFPLPRHRAQGHRFVTDLLPLSVDQRVDVQPYILDGGAARSPSNLPPDHHPRTRHSSTATLPPAHSPAIFGLVRSTRQGPHQDGSVGAR